MGAGNVYNITPYIEFHPGGAAELMRGAGIDCSELFDEVFRPACIFIQHIQSLLLYIDCYMSTALAW